MNIHSLTVIGAGLAGCFTAHAFAAQGFDVHIFEQGTGFGTGASGNLAGALHPQLTAAPSKHGHFYAESFRKMVALLDDLQHRTPYQFWQQCGALWSAGTPEQQNRYQKIAGQAYCADLVEWVDAAKASRIAGVELAHPALFLPTAGWVRPALLCQALCAAFPEKITLHWDMPVTHLKKQGTHWVLNDDFRAKRVIIANASAALQLPQTAHLPLHITRGQVTYLPATPASQALQTILCGNSYIIPAIDNTHVIGATFQRHDTDTANRLADTCHNLHAAQHLLPQWGAWLQTLDAENLENRSGLRASFPDHLPRFAWLEEGLGIALGLGSRGLVSAIAATTHLTQMPLPMFPQSPL
jgi:tRNA 5-methylaminomethyl-2-thiouridine biosynthesis bifunctional protein